MIERQDERRRDAKGVQASFVAAASAIEEAATAPPNRTIATRASAAIRAACSALACIPCALICASRDHHEYTDWPEITK